MPRMAVKTLSYREWREIISKVESDPAGQPAQIPNGYSPGGAAAVLGVSRPAINQAILRGHLDATRIPAPTGRGYYWFITPEALEEYRKRPHRAAQGYR